MSIIYALTLILKSLKKSQNISTITSQSRIYFNYYRFNQTCSDKGSYTKSTGYQPPSFQLRN